MSIHLSALYLFKRMYNLIVNYIQYKQLFFMYVKHFNFPENHLCRTSSVNSLFGDINQQKPTSTNNMHLLNSQAYKRRNYQ